MKNVLIGIIAALAVIGIYILITGNRIAGPWYEDPIGSSTASRAVEDVAYWKTYENDKYGFSLKYPEYYSDLREVGLDERVVRYYDPTTKKATDKRIRPVVHLAADSEDAAHPDESVAIMVFEEENYGFSDVPGGRAWSYYVPGGSMWRGATMGTSSWARVTPSLEGVGWKGFEMGTGDAGYSVRAVALPARSKDIILEMSFGQGPTSKGSQPVNQILSTLRLK